MEEKKGGFTHDSADNKSVDWYTPPWVFAVAKMPAMDATRW